MNGRSNPAAEKKKISSKYVTGMNNAVSIPMIKVDAESIHTWSDPRGIV